MPGGICTIDSSESTPSSFDDRQWRHRRRHPRQMGGAAGAGDDHRQAAVGGGARVLVEHVGCAVGGHHAYLERDSELGEDVDRGPHDREIGVAAHDHSHERVRHGLSSVAVASSGFAATVGEAAAAAQASVTACAHD
jgi:hypothetical protein